MRKFPTDYKMINTKDIIVSEEGQRDVERRPGQFKRIMREFNPNLANDIKVAAIDGKYYIIDGQMTRKVLIEHNGGEDLPVHCKVFMDITPKEAAELFVLQNGTAVTVDITDKLRVNKFYGDPTATDFVARTEQNGLAIAWTRKKSRGAIMAVATAFNVYKDFDDKDNYSALIRIIANAWNGDPDGAQSAIINGLAHFIKVYKGQYKEERLSARLGEVKPTEIVRNAKVDRSSGPRKYAVQILQIYNHGLRGESHLPMLL